MMTLNTLLPTILDNTTPVSVQLEWNGWQSADVRVDDLENVHWWQPPGAPRALLHAYVMSAKLNTGEVGSTNANDSLQQRLLVCVLKSHTPPATYNALVSKSAPRS